MSTTFKLDNFAVVRLWPAQPKGLSRDVSEVAPIKPIALEAVKRIDALFDTERDISGLSAEKRLAVRREEALRGAGTCFKVHEPVGLKEQQFGSEKQDAVWKNGQTFAVRGTLSRIT